MATTGNRSVLFVIDDWWACAWYRAYVPGVQLKKLGYDVVMDDKFRLEDIERFDVIVFQRKYDPRFLEAIRQANAAGKLTVYELDDDLWSVARNNPAYNVWGNPQILAGAVGCMRECAMITTTTHYLANRLRTFNPNVKVLPNMLPASGWDYPEPHEQREDRVVLGWAGSSSHVEDLHILDDVVQQMLDRYPHVEFAIAGGSMLANITEGERVHRLAACDIRNYPKLLESFDIGLIPLTDTAFNRAKSDLKFVEYSMQGIPSVASKLEPYLKSIKHGENGFLAANGKDWIKSVSRLVEDIDLRRTIGARAQEYARTRTIEDGIVKWEKAYGLTRE